MKIVFASYSYAKDFNDPQKWIKRMNAYFGILEALSQIDEVISIEQINYEGVLLNNGVNYHFKQFSKQSSRFFPWQMHAYIKSLNPDVVFIHGMHYPFQFIQLRWQLDKKVNLITQNHGEKPFKGLKKYLQLFADKYINAYLFASRDMGMDWIKKGNLKDSNKIHEVMEISSVFYPIKKELALLKTGIVGSPIYLWVGRLNDNKDPLTVVNAFLAFSEINPSARLYMLYGTTELLEEIEQLLNKTNYKNAIVLVERISHDDMLYWFNSADFIISSSFHEAGGTAVCEAMSCGCFPILTNIFSFRTMTDNGTHGILYESGNKEACLSALMETLDLDISVKKEKVLTYYTSMLSFKAIAEKIHRIARSL